MKWIGLLLLAGTFCGMGIKTALRYKRDMELWKNLEKLADYFMVELRLTCDEPVKILRRYPAFCHLNFSKEDSFEDTFSRCFPKEILCDESVIAFVYGLGKTDLEGQLSHCGRYGRAFLLRYEEAVENYEVKGKLHQKLWMLAGVAVLLLLV